MHHDKGPEADLYLEGHDQHRGWFHSSLLLASAIFGRAPYRGLLTHGFTVDGQGKKMSKSLGNTVAPQECRQDGRRNHPPVGGLDRLLGRPGHRRQDPGPRGGRLPPHPQHAALPAGQHQRLRPGKDAVAYGEMLEIDRYALARAAQLQQEILAHYKVYEFHPVVAKLQLFCSEDLGGFYLDVLKDRLYTTRPRAWPAARPRPRSPDHPGAAALDGALPVLHGRRSLEDRGHSESIFLEKFTELPAGDEPAGQVDASARSATWSTRTSKPCATGAVGSSLQAEVTLTAEPEDLALLQSLGTT
jgi:isoleucyl-tRNA synthetase